MNDSQDQLNETFEQKLERLSKSNEQTLDNFNKYKALTDATIEQMDSSMRENSVFASMENRKSSASVRSLETAVSSIREAEISEQFDGKWLAYQKDFVKTELYRKQMQDYAQRLHDIEFELQNDTARKTETDPTTMTRIIEDKINKELRQGLARRIEDVEHFNTRKELQYNRLERLMETSKAHEIRIENALDLIDQVQADVQGIRRSQQRTARLSPSTRRRIVSIDEEMGEAQSLPQIEGDDDSK